MAKTKSYTKDPWTVDTVIDDPKIMIPIEVYAKIKGFNTLVDEDKKLSGNEYSIVTKGSWVNNDFLVEDFLWVPPQEVGQASVDFIRDKFTLEETKKFNESNVIIHRHPWANADRFSGSDLETLSTNFTVSLLVEKSGTFTSGTLSLNLKSGQKYILKDVQIIIIGNDDYMKDELKNIKTKTYNYNYGYYNNYSEYSNVTNNNFLPGLEQEDWSSNPTVEEEYISEIEDKEDKIFAVRKKPKYIKKNKK